MLNIIRVVSILFIAIGVLIFSTCLNAQYSNSQIDSLHRVSNILRKKGEFDKAELVYNIMLENSKHNHYLKGIAQAYVRLANLHTLQGNFTRANLFLDSAQVLANRIDNPWLLVTVKLEQGRSFYNLNLIERSLESLNRALSLVHRISQDSIRRERTSQIYEYQSVSYEKLKETDSAFSKVKLAFSIYPRPVMASRISRFYLKQYKKVDSAQKYLRIARNMISEGRYSIHDEAMVLRMEGIYEFEIRSFKKAAAFYLKSIEISRKLGLKADELVTNRLLSATYKEMADKQGLATTQERYFSLSDSLSTESLAETEKTIERLLDEKDRAGNKRRLQLYGLILSFIVIVIAFLYRAVRKSRIKLTKSEHELAEKKKIIEETIKEQEILSQKVNESFEELLRLAKDNSTAFFPRFCEVYPRLKEKLFNINPTLRSSELTLCAYIYLNLSSKEIAEFTFKSIRTIQGQKSDLRKRLFISSSQDLYSWMRLQDKLTQ